MRLVLLLALLLPATAFAQASAVGATADSATLVVTVVSADGEPLDFADVFLPEILVGGRTDADGIARLSGLAPGAYRVEVTPFDWRATTITQSVQISDDVTFLRVTTLMAVAVAAPGPTTGRLTGTVTDETGETLPGATVFLPQIQRGAGTDIDGNYTIISIPVGTYEVQFSSVGFGTQIIEDVQISADRTRQLEIFLATGQELEAVVLDGGCDPFWRGFYGFPRVQIMCGEELMNRPDRYTNGDGLALTSVYSR